MIFQIMAQCHRKPSSCGISCHNDILCKPTLTKQPLICAHCIFQCRRIWIFRCHTVINGEYTHPFADFIVKSRKHAVCIPHRSYISATVKLQDHLFPVRILFQFQPFHRKMFHFNSRQSEHIRTFPRRFDHFFPQFTAFDFPADQVIVCHMRDQVTHDISCDARFVCLMFSFFFQSQFSDHKPSYSNFCRFLI